MQNKEVREKAEEKVRALDVEVQKNYEAHLEKLNE